MELHEKLKKLRIQNWLTQKALSEKLNISENDVCKYETISMPFPPTLLNKYAILFGFPLEDLVDTNKEILTNDDYKEDRPNAVLYILHAASFARTFDIRKKLKTHNLDFDHITKHFSTLTDDDREQIAKCLNISEALFDFSVIPYDLGYETDYLNTPLAERPAKCKEYGIPYTFIHEFKDLI